MNKTTAETICPERVSVNGRLALVTNRLLARGDGAVRELSWTVAAQIAGIAMRLGSSLLLTRLLAPEAFGVMGTAMAFLTTLEWLSDVGIQPAVLRHPRGGDLDVLSTGCWLTLTRGIGISAAAIASAWPLACFYEQPELFGILAVLGLRPVIMSLRSPGVPLLRRQMNYRAVFFDEIGTTIAGTACSITISLIVSSVWAIVGGTLAGAIAAVGLSYLLVPVIPGAKDPIISRELWSFGTRVLLNTIMMAAWLNIDRLLGLKFISDAEMGLYAVAWNLAAVLDTMLNRACDVHFSMLSRTQVAQDKVVLHEGVMNRIAEWIAPGAAIVVSAAPGVIWLLYDERYAAAQPLLLILLSRAILRGIGQAQFQLLLSENLIRIGTLSYFVALIVQCVVIWPLCVHYGVIGLALSVLMSTACVTLVQAFLAAGRPGFSRTPVLRSIFWSLVPLLLLQSLS